MSLRRKLTGMGLAFGLILSLSAVAFSQQGGQPSTNGPQEGSRQRGPWEGRGGRRDGMGKRGRGGMLRLASKLNLTEAQQQQMRAIEDRFESSTKSQREELRSLRESTQGGEPSADTRARFQDLRRELEQARRNQHQEMLNVLTAEQRAQLEQLMKERKARHGERRGRGMDQPNDDDQ